LKFSADSKGNTEFRKALRKSTPYDAGDLMKKLLAQIPVFPVELYEPLIATLSNSSLIEDNILRGEETC